MLVHRRFLALLCGLACAVPLAAQEEAGAGNRVSLFYEQSRFDTDLDPWHLAWLELARQTSVGTVVLRGSAARRFGTDGRQVEIDAYPRIASAVYAYLNAGYSPTDLFPGFRYGAELFGSVGGGVELSGGARHLRFEQRAVTIFTGSAGLYRGNYYLVARPFVTPDQEADALSVSGFVMARRYFRDSEEWISLRLGGGATPAEEFTTAELERLGSLRVALEAKRPVARLLHLRLSAGLEREELAPGTERGKLTVGLGLERRF